MRHNKGKANVNLFLMLRIKLVLDPRIMYRGLLMSITNMAVLTGLQFPLTGALTRFVTGGKERRLTEAEMVSTAFWGGAISGVACAPMELIMIQQQVERNCFHA
jgi:hypothetical protein